jgi:hypothetical protein
MKKYIIILFSLALSYSMLAQSLQRSVLGTSGKIYTTGTYKLSFTLGEVATARYDVGSGLQVRQGFQQNFISNLPLPITGLDFYAQRISPTIVELRWQTLTETNNHGFYIERKLDNENEFSQQDFIDSKAEQGNSSIQLGYAWVDTNAFSGNTYYRIKQEDIDGKNSYSLLRVVHGDPTGNLSLQIWPNPSTGFVQVQVLGSSKKHAIHILDAQGKVIRNLAVENQQSCRIDGLSPGVYFIRLIGDEHVTQKIVVQ